MLDPVRTSCILALAEALRKSDSWCGETHLQKAMFFLKERCGVPVEFPFVLYKHGPYSFDFHDSLSMLFAHCLIENEVQPPYGPRIRLSEAGKRYLAKHQDRLADTQDKIESVAMWFGSKGVMELEKMATALWVQTESPTSSAEELAQQIHTIKPHISTRDAFAALSAVSDLS